MGITTLHEFQIAIVGGICDLIELAGRVHLNCRGILPTLCVGVSIRPSQGAFLVVPNGHDIDPLVSWQWIQQERAHVPSPKFCPFHEHILG